MREGTRVRDSFARAPLAWRVCARRGVLNHDAMLYAILCYDSEKTVASWSKEQDDAAIAKLEVVQHKWAAEGRLGPVARLMTTDHAKTLRKGRSSFVVDGPFAETKEQLLGFFV